MSGKFVVGGEQLHFEDLAAFRNGSLLEIFNEYGPTEATVGCFVFKVADQKTDQGPVPIGCPFERVGAHYGSSEHDGKRELVLSGPGLADGYIHPDENSCFFDEDGERYYSTGDLVRRDTSTGNLYFCGRVDTQAKVNGHRVDMLEVEAALSVAAPNASGVFACVIEHQIVAAISGQSRMSLSEVRQRLCAMLPTFMVPDEVLHLEHIPFTRHSKVDRSALQQTLTDRKKIAKQESSSGISEITQSASRAWMEVLGGNEPSPECDFFASGGDSIAALRLIGRLSSHFGKKLQVSILFDQSKFGAFVSTLAEHLQPDKVHARKRQINDVNGAPLSPNQLAMITGHVTNPDKAAYTVVSAAYITGSVDWSALPKAVEDTILRHDVFRWRLSEHKDWGAAAFPVEKEGLAIQVDFADGATNHLEEVANARIEELDPFAASPTIRFRVHTTSPRETLAILVTHHCFVDELSVELLWQELFERLAGAPHQNKPSLSYRTWSDNRIRGEDRDTVVKHTKDLANQVIQTCASTNVPVRHSVSSEHKIYVDHFVELPEAVKSIVTTHAKRIRTSVETVLSAAAGWTAIRVFRMPLLINHTPVTQRKSDADFTGVGCFVANLPLIFTPPMPGEPAAYIVSNWRKAVATLLDKSDADPALLDETLQRNLGYWDRVLRVSIAAQRTSAGENSIISWETLPIIDGPLKFDLSWMFSICHRKNSISTRIAAGAEFSSIDAGLLYAAFQETLYAICRNDGVAPKLAELDNFGKNTTAMVQGAADPLGRDLPVDEETSLLAEWVARACTDVLGSEVFPESDLFSSGLKSLSALKLVARMHSKGYVKMDVADVYEFRTPVGIARYITALDFLN